MNIDDFRGYPRLVWLRDYASLWLARVDEASNEVNTFWFAVIGISTSASALKSYGQDELVLPGIAAFIVLGIVYVWGYDKFRFMREKSQQKSIRKQNYVRPQTVINHRIRAAQLEAAVEAINGGDDVDIDALTTEYLREYFKGVPLEDINGGPLNHDR